MLRNGGKGELRSFPTRRSSDLLGRVAGTARGGVPLPRDRGPAAGDRGGEGGSGGAEPDGPPGLRGCRDRKSTRLNSSHPSISYAVFCLKKKNSCVQQPTKGIKE